MVERCGCGRALSVLLLGWKRVVGLVLWRGCDGRGLEIDGVG